ncbi:putative bifunctional diguanylate cyclase/phosphodiesterase [Halomonas sp. HK25]|uniref:putative bifunctional diguanylate cyclase/phosphodiesterase n=1 Tax=Halomonas sp. HK25 TaxID=3394321 RepID=UPI0039FBFC1D
MSKRRLLQATALIALAITKDRHNVHHRTLAEWHRSLFVNHPDGVYEFDLEGRFQRGNAAMERITGYPEQDMVGRHFNEFVAADYRELTQAAFDAARAGTSRHYETVGTHADGHSYHLEVTNFPVTVEGEIVGVYGICRDITQRKQQEARIVYQATHDLLTGLPNRTALDDRLEHDLRRSRQNRRLLAVLYLDLDGFKAINDGLGHRLGNQLLVAVAERLQPLLGPHDTLARLTGDEFAVLMPTLTTREEVAVAAERILATFEHSFEIDGRALHISTSIGIACSDEPIQQAHELLQQVNLALDVAKQQGRNTWQWYLAEAKQHTSEHVLLRHDLHTALRDQQFALYYQPIVDARSGRICSVEALVRWHHPTHGMISPGVFIPIAEQTGQIIPLGRWVLRHACRSLADLHAKGQRVYPVAVNISSLQFRRDGFLAEVQAILDETGLPPKLLELEMTESILLEGAEQAIEMIRTLRRMGISVAIDDFGTGFSSLSYLRDLPIHKIKLDRAFIQDILTSRPNAAIVEGIITMAHHMDLAVVAEGVEEQEQQEDLARRGCDLLQGFLFARPMPLDDLLALPDTLPPQG